MLILARRLVLMLNLTFPLMCLAQSDIMTTGLKAYYPFNGNSKDESGNGNNGYLKGSATILKGNLVLNGIDGLVELSDFVRINGSSTISLRVFISSIESGYTEILSQGSPLNGFTIGIDPLKRLRVTAGSGNEIYSKFFQFFENRWVSIDIVSDSLIKTTRLYIDGKLDSEHPENISFGDYTGLPCRIGAGINNSSHHFSGLINYVRFYNVPLALPQINTLYNFVLNQTEYAFIKNSLVAYYPFDGNLNDESGNRNFASPNNVIYSIDRYGNQVAAGKFNGTNSFVEIPSQISLAREGTFSAWVKRRSWNYGSAGCSLFSYSRGLPNSGKGDILTIGVHPNLGGLTNLYIGYYGSGKWNIASSNHELAKGVWEHVACVWTSTDAKIYINGDLQGSIGFPEMILPSQMFIRIGASSWNQTFFDGEFDDVRLYNRPLAVSEIAALYSYEKTIDNPYPIIDSQPQSQIVADGGNAFFCVSLKSSGNYSYQWQINEQNILGATMSCLTLNTVKQVMNGSRIRVIVSSTAGTVVSDNATIGVSVNSLPTVIVQPTSTNAVLGGGVIFSAVTEGSSSYSYQWQFNGENIIGATLANLAINSLQINQSGWYRVIVGSQNGITISQPVYLNVHPNDQVIDSQLTVYPAVDVEYSTVNGVRYQLEVSTDMTNWTPEGGVVVGNGGNQNHLVRANKVSTFWRLKVVP